MCGVGGVANAPDLSREAVTGDNEGDTQVVGNLVRRKRRRFESCTPHQTVAGWGNQETRGAHNPEIGGSNPPPATNNKLY